MASKRFRILALSGGGYRGLYSAALLANIEALYQKEYPDFRCADKFDLIIGTSAGALLAAAVALKLPLSQVVNDWKSFGPDIFKDPNPITGLIREIAAKTKLIAKYPTKGLEVAIDHILTTRCAADQKRLIARPLSELPASLAILAVNHRVGQVEVFRAGRCPDSRALITNNTATLKDALIASAAAPTYFPKKTIGQETYIDGGLAANAPELVGVSYVLDAFRAVTLDQICILSVGTVSGSSRKPVAWRDPVNLASIFHVSLYAQQQLAVSMSQSLLGTRYLRIDAEPPGELRKAFAELDGTSKTMTDNLIELADETWRKEKNNAILRSFFQPEPPVSNAITTL